MKLTASLEDSIIEWVEYLLPYSNDLDIDFWRELLNENDRLRLIVLYGYLSNQVIWQKEYGVARIAGITETVSSHKNCGVVSEAYFSTEIASVSEAMNFNSCLNRKIAIDIHGNIKNCPSMSESYGNIRDIALIDAVQKPGFKKYWNINKDKIHVCKDCEFRYICTDCRAYVDDPEDIYSKPLKCGYNPYTGEWSVFRPPKESD